jgi:hypothetical protein
VQGHDMEVLETVQNLLTKVDVVMLAQISIARIKDHLDGVMRSRVLSSLDFIAPEIRRISERSLEG